MKIKENIWNWMGFAVGIVIFIAGIVFYLTPPESYHASSADKVSFGADFYSYQYEATRIVASNTAVTANNIRELGAAISQYAGFFFIAMGLLTVIHYGKVCFVKEVPAVEAAEVPENSSDHENADPLL